jgi:hypothetical protein
MQEYKIVRFSEEQIDAFLWLYSCSFNSDPNKELFVKKFNTTYSGKSYIAFMAYDLEGCPAAFYGVFPCIYQNGSEKLLGAQSGDTMTHPNHRKKGLFYKLAKATYNLAYNEGIKYIYGIPNGNSYHGFQKMGWKTPYTIMEYEKGVSPKLFTKVLRRISRNAYKKHINNLIQKHKIQEALKCNRNGSFSLYRDEKYLKYKKYNQNVVLSFKSGKAWVSYKVFDLVIGDLEPIADKNKLDLINELIDFASKVGCSKVVAYDYSFDQNGMDHLKGFVKVEDRHIIILDQGLSLETPIAISATDFDTF